MFEGGQPHSKRGLIGNSAQYQNDNKYSRKRQANRFCNRALVSHDSNLDFQNDMNTGLIYNSLRLIKLGSSKF
jgi:hypothetical protein